jgi:glutamate formiminotransferase
MPRQLVECVPNFSEGRDSAKMDAIVQAILSVPEVSCSTASRMPTTIAVSSRS